MTGGEFRALAAALPDVEERMTWGEVTFRIVDRMIASMDPDGTVAGIKATLDRQAELIATRPETFSVAHYTGRFGWVAVDLATADPPLIRELLADAWLRTAPKRMLAAHPEVAG